MATTKAKKKKTPDDAALKTAVLMAALEDVPFDGFTPKILTAAGERAGADEIAMARLFPDGVLSLVEAFSDWADGEMEKRLEAEDMAAMKVRERIRTAVLARIAVLKPHKEAARRAGAFLTLPMHAPKAMALLYRTVDAMWRAAGDSSTDFNFYSKRAILAGVYSATLMRWFNDDSEDEAATHSFLAHRIDDVMRFEKFKAEVKKRARDWPGFGDILGASPRRRARR